jgi:hypothetical protein
MPHTVTPPSASDTLLVTATAGRIERALTERWQLPAANLHHAIDALRHRGVSRRVVAALHYLRMERNRVLHHPRQALRDPARYQALAAEVLPIIEGTQSAACKPAERRGSTRPAPLPAERPWHALPGCDTPRPSSLVLGLRALVDERRQALLQRQAVRPSPLVAAQQLADQAMARLRAIHARFGVPARL